MIWYFAFWFFKVIFPLRDCQWAIGNLEAVQQEQGEAERVERSEISVYVKVVSSRRIRQLQY